MSHPVTKPQLSGWAQAAKAHWKKYRPKMYHELQPKGQLNEAAQQAADNTADALNTCIDRGMNYDQAWEAVRENWMYLPSEEDQPKLGESQDIMPAELPEKPLKRAPRAK